MKKSVIISSVLILVIGLLYFTSAQFKYNRRVKNNINILRKDGTVYIPNNKDQLYYFDPQSEYSPDKNVKALYDIRALPEEYINTMLRSCCPNIRVYGYILYLRNVKDLNYDYLLKALRMQKRVQITYEYYSVFHDCYMSDVMLLAALNGMHIPSIMSWVNGKQKAYGEFSQEQIDILRTEYEKKEPVNKDIDTHIRRLFDDYFKPIE